ncbi:restriction endonuclease [Streptomyces sp. NPDC012888]|uniref:restriction endonuclease n=1 Tax=Streptomyces sp. NPDC012888 TaxID=3364855 RepID=UPI0036B11BEB
MVTPPERRRVGAGVRVRVAGPAARIRVRDLVLAVGLPSVLLGGVVLVLRTLTWEGAASAAWPLLALGLVVLGLVAAGRGRPGGATPDAPTGPEPWTVPAAEPAAVPAAAPSAGAEDPCPCPSPAPAADPAGVTVSYRELEPEGFEHAVAALCVRDGCTSVEVCGGAGDLGADVVATAPDGRRVVLQCKRYHPDRKVGSEDLQRFGGTCFTVHDASVAVLVTTSGFTEPAADYAARAGILCVDAEALAAWTAREAAPPWEGRP